MLSHLLSPIRIRNMELKNRCVIPPMGTNLGNRDGTVSEKNLAYIKRRAESGVGLIISEILMSGFVHDAPPCRWGGQMTVISHKISQTLVLG